MKLYIKSKANIARGVINSLRIGLISLIVLGVHTVSHSQITITIADVATTNDTIYLRVDTTLIGGTQSGTIGPNQVWNFSGLSGILEDTTFFIPQSSAPSSTNFPLVNLVSKQNGQYVYFRKDSSGLFIHGLTIDFDTLFGTDPFIVNPPLKFIGFPSTFGTHFISNGSTNTKFAIQDTLALDSTTSFYVDSVRVNLGIQIIDSINGWGTLQMPNSINLPALRQQTVQTFNLTVDIKIENPLWGPNFPNNLLPRFIWIPLPAGILPSTSFSNRSVTYYTNGRRFPVLTLNLDSTGNILTANYQTTASIVAGLQEYSSGDHTLSIYPNPNQDGVINFTQPVSFLIFDLDGRQVFASDAELLKADISHLKAGVYLLKTNSGEIFKLVKSK